MISTDIDLLYDNFLKDHIIYANYFFSTFINITGIFLQALLRKNVDGISMRDKKS